MKQLFRACCFLLLLGAQSAWATLNCNSIFPGPIQSFANAGTLYMQTGARVENYNSLDVCFRQVRGYEYEMSNQACGSGKCQITGVASQIGTRPTMMTSTDPSNYTVASWTNPNVMLGTTAGYGRRVDAGRWDIGSVEVNGGNLTVSDQYSTYVLKGIRFFNNGSMTLKAGKTYIIDGDIDLSMGRITLVGSGTTKFYVNGNLTIQNGSQFTGSSALDVYVTKDLAVRSSAKIQGSYYVEGKATLQENADLRGRLSASNIDMLGSSKVIYDGGALTPTCKDIFTDPPSEGVSMTPPPGVLVPPLGDLVCSKQGNGTSCTGHSGNSFVPGDHDFNNGSISNKAEIIATGVTARLYFNNLDLNNAELNPNNLPENLFIYVKGDLKIAGQNKINAVVYVAGNVKMTGNASIEGALAAGGNIDSGGNSDFDFSQDAVDNVDLGGITCGGGSGGSQLDHFELTHSGQALTCNPETVVIKACANAGCSQLVTEQVSATLSLSPSSGNNGWVGGNQVVFSGGSTSAQLRNNTASAVTIGVSSSTPGFLHGTLCQAGSGALSAAACTLNFADSGFVFDVLDTLANKPQDVVISAVKKDTATQQCIPGFIGARSVGFWGTYTDPNTNIFNSKITIDGNAIPTYAVSVTSPAATTINLTFDSQGKATLKKVNYPDAGQMRLNARHDGSGDTAGLVMTGSDLFVSRPVGLCITPVQGVCAAGDASCPVFKKTGDDFQLNIGAVAWQADNDTDLCSGNLATPNFALTNIALGSKLVAPKPGVEAVVSKLSYDHAIAASNNLNTVTQSLNEVGVFRMTATPPSAGYFGYTIPAASSVPVGRFVPWDYSLSSGFITPACTPFSYMGQPFASGFAITARNAQQGTTLNYKGAFAKGSASLVAENGDDGVDRSARIGLAPGLSWVDGVASVNQQAIPLANTRFDRGASVEEPLPSLDFGVKMADNDGGYTLLAGVNMKADSVGICGSNCNAVKIGSQQLRYGRLLASTRQGVASAPLALPLQVQYFEGGQWRVNQQDLCTQISLAGGGIQFTDPDQHYDAGTGDLTLKDGTRIRLGLGQVAPGGSQVRVSAGETGFHFAAPNQTVRIPYQILLDKQPLQPSAPLWLSDPNSLLGEAIFGQDRGNDRIIYRREVMP